MRSGATVLSPDSSIKSVGSSLNGSKSTRSINPVRRMGGLSIEEECVSGIEIIIPSLSYSFALHSYAIGIECLRSCSALTMVPTRPAGVVGG